MNLVKRVSIFMLFGFSLLCISCTKTLGYSVVLWSIPEEGIHDAEIVPVYIKSNINHVYVAGSNNSDKKFEVELWKLTVPESKKKAEERLKKYLEYQYQYARVKLDGLPIRYEPTNTGRQVYRLRENEIIKVLYKGKGVAVMSGSKQMEGDWLRVLTIDGTEGWCFSYNLALFDERESDGTVEEVDTQDALLESVLQKKWYPDYYKKMIDSGDIDLSRMAIDFGFNPGKDSELVTLKLVGVDEKAPFEGVLTTGNRTYKFIDTNFTMSITTKDSITVQYIDETGLPTSYSLISLSEDIGEIINAEVERRDFEYQQLQLIGPAFSSSNYGRLQFQDDNAFIWTGYKLLSPDIIPNNAGRKGTVELKYFLSSSLKNSYDGVLTFNFENSLREVNFLYKFESDGLKLEDIATIKIKDSIVLEQNPSPVVVFFAN